MLGMMVGAICQRLTGHWYGSWKRASAMPGLGYIVEFAVCRLCRQEYMRMRIRQKDDDIAEQWAIAAMDALDFHKYMVARLDRSFDD